MTEPVRLVPIKERVSDTCTEVLEGLLDEARAGGFSHLVVIARRTGSTRAVYERSGTMDIGTLIGDLEIVKSKLTAECVLLPPQDTPAA